MTWSYTLTTLQSTPKDQVRFVIGDTDENCPQLQDEEIQLALSIFNSPTSGAFSGSIYGAAAVCCESLASHMSRLADQTSGTSSISYSQRSRAYAKRAKEFWGLLSERFGGAPYAGGISVSDVVEQLSNTDRVQPAFAIGMDDDYLPVSPGENPEQFTGSPEIPGPE